MTAPFPARPDLCRHPCLHHRPYRRLCLAPAPSRRLRPATQHLLQSVSSFVFLLSCYSTAAVMTSARRISGRSVAHVDDLTHRHPLNCGHGSEQEFDEAPILCRLSDLLKLNEFGVCEWHW